MDRRAFLAGALACLAHTAHAAQPVYAPVKPSAKDKCPVCGMFVAKYPDFLSQVIYRDKAYALFDGAKDMFKYVLALQSYAPSRQRADVAAMYVTDYYALTPTDAIAAWYVIGSDIYGPMGRELVPFSNEGEAKEFLADHKGKRLIRYDQVTAAVLKELD